MVVIFVELSAMVILSLSFFLFPDPFLYKGKQTHVGKGAQDQPTHDTVFHCKTSSVSYG